MTDEEATEVAQMVKDAFDFPAFGVATQSAAIIERAAAATLPMSGPKTT